MKYTDPKTVRDLAKNVLKDSKDIANLVGELDAELKKLESTFLDDSIEDVKGYVGKVSKGLGDSLESFFTVAEQLVAYAHLLEQGK